MNTREKYETDSLEITRKHIRRSGRLLSIACRIGMIILAVTVVFHLGVCAAVLIDGSAAKDLSGLYDKSTFVSVNVAEDEEAGEELIPLNWQVAINGAISAISSAALLLYVRMLDKYMLYLAHGEKPFNVEEARRMRKQSILLLVLPLSNFAVGIVAFALAMLFSYMIEYGGYLQEKADRTNMIQEEIIESFAEITENKSGQTGQHIKRVAEYSRIIAEEMGLGASECEKIRISSTMHDIGKLLIPSEILEKPGRLTAEEYATVKQHTTYGGRLLEHVDGDVMELSRRIALQHHERFDGNGYPSFLEGDGISLEGRIVAVADVYDALTSKRSYKEAWDEADAYREIMNGRGTQFDPDVVDAFSRAYGKILDVKNRFAD